MTATGWENINVGIVGGQGRMGRWFQQRFEQQGIKVLITDRGTNFSINDICKRCQVVIISVPITVSVEVINQVAPLVKEDGLLMDFTSNKSAAVEAMLNQSKCEVVGAHPLFGPGEESIQGRHIVLCPGRGELWFNKIKNLLEQMGAVVTVTDPETHDRMMGSVQGLTHFNALAMALTIKESGLDPLDLDVYATTSFTRLRDQMERTLRQETDLIAAIATMNPYVYDAVVLLEAQVKALKKMVQNKDIHGFADQIRQARSFLNVEPGGSS